MYALTNTCIRCSNFNKFLKVSKVYPNCLFNPDITHLQLRPILLLFPDSNVREQSRWNGFFWGWAKIITTTRIKNYENNSITCSSSHVFLSGSSGANNNAHYTAANKFAGTGYTANTNFANNHAGISTTGARIQTRRINKLTQYAPDG
jgi:hypothetical protein